MYKYFFAIGITMVAALFLTGCGDNGANSTDSYTLNIVSDPKDGGTVDRSPTKTAYKAGERVTVTATANSGYEFVNWSGTLNGATANLTFVMDGNVSLTANFRQRTPDAHTVTFNANGGSGTPPSQQTVNAGSAITLPNQGNLTRSGYDFGGWNTNSSGTGTNYSAGSSYTPNSSITLYAKWNTSSSGIGTTFTDSRDGKTYKKIAIGTQVWMAQNLNYDVPNVTTDVCYENSVDSCAKYGRLYNWYTAMNGASGSSAIPSGIQGVCPVNWHLPSDAEWTTLTDYTGGLSTAGRKLKSTSGWYNNGNGTDDYGFSALPSGIGYSLGNFDNVGNWADWWSATDYGALDALYAWSRHMSYSSGNVNRFDDGKTVKFSVRCVAD
jgi:uncharacterized protein (TIGR02145 family)/uncharacterized repeat protein (TIGR02543 family)